MAKETRQRFYKAFLRSTPFMASVTTYSTVISAVGYLVIETLEDGVNRKLVEQDNTLAVKLEAEKVKREGFQSMEQRRPLLKIPQASKTLLHACGRDRKSVV